MLAKSVLVCLCLAAQGYDAEPCHAKDPSSGRSLLQTKASTGVGVLTDAVHDGTEKSTCVADWSDCTDELCCSSAEFTCYEKWSGKAQCRKSCTDSSWTCTVLTSTTTTTTTTTTTLCGGSGTAAWGDCTTSECCSEAGYTCYQRDDDYAQCRTACPSSGWTCDVLSTCAADWGDCSDELCCSSAEFTCYEKYSGKAQCRKTCTDSSWTCTVLVSTTTTTTIFYSPVAIIPQMPAAVATQIGCPDLSGYQSLSTLIESSDSSQQDITLSESSVYVLDSSATIGILNIPSSAALIFADLPDLHLSVKSIIVDGTLQLGLEECPLLSSNIIITLRGGSDHGIYSEHENHSKGIIANSGAALNMHGKVYSPTWARLAQTAAVGDSEITLDQSVNWEVGMELVVMTTTIIDEEEDHQNEVRSIASVLGDVITLNASLAYSHYGGPEYSAEVALLSRSITVQGDSYSETSSFGGHTMCMNGVSECKISYVMGYRMGQLNVMGRYPFHFHLMGTIGGSSGTSGFFRGITVYHSFFRAFTIHGTSNSTVSRNVAYDIQGNAYYLEDGVEENNEISFNLAAFVHIIDPLDMSCTGYGCTQLAPDPEIITQDSRIVPTDVAAAGFYCTNQNNNWTGNAASGGFTGFMFPNLPAAVGSSYNDAQYTDYVPGSKDLLEFNGNTAHSSGRHWNGGGACMYVGGWFWQEDDEKGTSNFRYNYGRSQPDVMQHGGMIFKNLKTFVCRRGFMFWGADGDEPYVTLEQYESHDFAIGAQMLGITSMRNAVLSATTDNAVTSATTGYGYDGMLTPAVGFWMYDTGAQTVLDNVTFRNFNRDGDMCLTDLTFSNEEAPQDLLSVSGLSFYGTPDLQRAQHSREPACKSSAGGDCAGDCDACPGTSVSSQHANMQDEDGSLTGFSGGGIMGAYDTAAVTNNGTNDWWLLDDTCTKAFTLVQDEMDNNQNVQDSSTNGFITCPKVSPNAWASQRREVVSVKLVNDGNTPDAWDISDNALKGTIYHFGQSNRKIQVGLSGTIQVTGPCCDIGWYLVSDEGALAEMMIYMSAMPMSGGLVFATQYPADAELTVQRCYWNTCNDVTLAASKAAFLATDDGTTYFLESGTVFLKMVNDHSKNVYYDPYGGAKLLTNSLHTSKHRYVIQSTLTGSVDFSLPDADWLSA